MKKIMFSDKHLLTQAVLDGTKTMTRRLLRDNVPLGNWEETVKHLPYKVGEVVAIAQPYKDIIECLPMHSDAILDEVGMPRKEFKAGWTNKMFVKADLMKHHIKITDVKVERIQSISVDDILCEGVWQFYDNKNLFYVSKNIGYAPDVAFLSAREAFWYLIDNISGKGTWESNPWVVAYSFELVDKK
nr:MAG TPA: ASCH domain protein [Caudoviricetes sp.]